MNAPGPFFGTPPFVIKGSYVQISPCDERCQVGEVEIRPDGRGRFPEIEHSRKATARRTTKVASLFDMTALNLDDPEHGKDCERGRHRRPGRIARR